MVENNLNVVGKDNSFCCTDMLVPPGVKAVVGDLIVEKENHFQVNCKPILLRTYVIVQPKQLNFIDKLQSG